MSEFLLLTESLRLFNGKDELLLQLFVASIRRQIESVETVCVCVRVCVS